MNRALRAMPVASSTRGKVYWFLRGLLAGLVIAWVIEVSTTEGLGPIFRYAAPVAIAGLISMSFYDMWANAKVNAREDR